jgi:hypothetical protein
MNSPPTPVTRLTDHPPITKCSSNDAKIQMNQNVPLSPLTVH